MKGGPKFHAWRAPHVLWLALLWSLLWGDAAPGVLVTGAAVGAAVLALAPTPATVRTVRPVPALRFLAAVALDIARANIRVAIEVVTPTDRTRPGVVDVVLPTPDRAVVTATSQAVNLAPGSVVVGQPDPAVLRIHVLHLDDAGAIADHVRHLAALAEAALTIRHREGSG